MEIMGRVRRGEAEKGERERNGEKYIAYYKQKERC